MTGLNSAHGEVRVRIIDAFTDRPLTGNPAGVVLLNDDTWPENGVMLKVAEELGHETAFAYRLADHDEADWALRWFTPGSESNVCGHATLATLHALRSDFGGPLSVRFSTGYGLLVARADSEGPITLDFPTAALSTAPVPDGLADALGIAVDGAVATGALGDLIALTTSEAEVRAMTPNIGAVADVIAAHGLRGIITTAEAEYDHSRRYDFVSRFFAPASGIAEDPVTGSAHTALAPFWARRLQRNSVVGFQASERSGLVATVVRGDKTELTGHAVTVLDGQLRFR